MAPAVTLLLAWMLIPLSMTLFFSFKKYLPLRGGDLGWVGFDNYVRFVSSSAFWPSVAATLTIIGSVLVVTIVLGVALALLLDQPMWGQGIVRILVIAPFFCHADCVCSCLEKHVYGSNQRHSCAYLEVFWSRAS